MTHLFIRTPDTLSGDRTTGHRTGVSAHRMAMPTAATPPRACRKDQGAGRLTRPVGALILAVLLFIFTTATARAVPPGTVIDNIAQAAYNVSGTPQTAISNTASLTTTWQRTASQIELMQYAPALSGAQTINVPITEASTDGTTANTVQITTVYPAGSTTPVDLSQPVPITGAGVYHQGEPVFVRITDTDQNMDPAMAESVWIQVTVPGLADSELLLVGETGPDTGIFAGYIQSAGSLPPAANDGALSVAANLPLTAQYIDPADPTDAVSASAMVDPYGLVFDAGTGAALNGAAITLIDDTTGLPAAVRGDDGVSNFPSTITSGATVVDSSGKVYAFAPGNYRFPFVSPGTYRLVVAPPAGYGAPSTIATAVLQSLPGAPFVIVNPGSRGEAFVLNPGPSVRIDIPVDPIGSGLWLQKAVSQETAAIGDFVRYTLTLENTTAAAVDVTVEDTLPVGLRYQKGSARLNGQRLADPQIDHAGRHMVFSAGSLAAAASFSISYVTEVGAGTPLGKAVNQAGARSASGLTSNTARAAITVKEDLFRRRNIIVGRVIADNCANAPQPENDGVKGVRIYLEDGTYVVTDEQGMFHFEGVANGSHVVQIDLDSLPGRYDIALCEDHTRFAGTPFSRFVDLSGGTLWRTDFHVTTKPPPAGQASLHMACDLQDRTVGYRADLSADTVDLEKPSLTVMLPAGASYMKGSSRMAGAPIADPSVMGDVLIFRLDRLAAGQTRTLSWQVALGNGIQPGRLHTKGLLTFNTAAAKGQRTPLVDTILALSRRTERTVQPPIIVRPQFDSLSADLKAADKAMLDDLIGRLSGLTIEHISLVGHTDNRAISSAGRQRFADNRALSLARARQVADYLAPRLNLTPDRMTVVGRGADAPMADNATTAGRALNRRVQVRVMTARIRLIHDVATVKCEDATRIATRGSRPSDPSTVESTATATPALPAVPEPADVERLTPGLSWLQPAADAVPPIPSVKIVVQHDPAEHLELLLDGRPVSKLNFDGTEINRAKTVAVSRWRGVDIADGDNLFTLVRKDRNGQELGRLQRRVHYSGAPVKAVLVKEKSQLIANGKDAPLIAVRLTDKDGFPVRRGVVGHFSVAAPYEGFDHRKDDKRIEELSTTQDEGPRYVVGDNGLALLRLRPTTQSGQASVTVPLAVGQEILRVWLRPEARQWILVGLAEGTTGYSTVSGNMENLERSDAKEDFYTDGRLAFFAKGKIKGSWLLTLSYDSARDRHDPDTRLFGQIDPNTYYTLYGDATAQRYDAASIRKLYVKVERDQFYAMFGDFDTGLTVTELGRYSRRFNGVKSEYQGEHIRYNAFASDTENGFVKDEIQGDGTSGLYRLSRRPVVINSEKITIETRDRFRSDIIIDSRTLNRFVDYSIDTDQGTLFFKSPVFSRDENFNPIYIVAEYEVAGDGSAAYTYGSRAAVDLVGDKVEVGATFIHEGPANAKGDLGGLDATVNLGRGIELKAEAATSRRDAGGQTIRGDALVTELIQQTGGLNTRLYYRQYGEGFGLGQQNGSEAETRKYGLDADYRFGQHWRLAGNAYRQRQLATAAEQDKLEADLAFEKKTYRLHGGMRLAEDRLGDGSVNRSTQLIAGASRRFWDNRLQARIDHEQSLFGQNDSLDFPTRTTLGLDYKMTANATVYAEHEITQGADQDSQSSRVGVKATPWKGGQVGSSVGRQYAENGQRLFATLGLNQAWQINERWHMDAGLDRSQTLASSGGSTWNSDVPAAAGAENDFTAVSLGAGYKADNWSWTGRVENRTGDDADKWTLISGVVGEPREGLGLSAGLQWFDNDTAGASRENSGDLRLGMAWRPRNTAWIVLDRLDFKYNLIQEPGRKDASRRIVNNLNANYKATRDLQVALQYGAKYVLVTFDDDTYDGYTDLTGIEARYDLTPRWDIGAQASVLHSWNAGQVDTRTGMSVGCAVVKNAWVSVGYNFTGFKDRDFSAAEFTAQGPYVKFRLKFDQQSVRQMVDGFGGRLGKLKSSNN